MEAGILMEEGNEVLKAVFVVLFYGRDGDGIERLIDDGVFPLRWEWCFWRWE